MIFAQWIWALLHPLQLWKLKETSNDLVTITKVCRFGFFNLIDSHKFKYGSFVLWYFYTSRVSLFEDKYLSPCIYLWLCILPLTAHQSSPKYSDLKQQSCHFSWLLGAEAGVDGLSWGALALHGKASLTQWCNGPIAGTE